MFNNFFFGKKVLITGHAGFKGSWLSFLLQELGARVSGYSLLPNSKPRLYELLQISKRMDNEQIADICDYQKLDSFLKISEPEIVIHLAAQPLVLESYKDPIGTYYTNVLGTLNLLEACRSCSSVTSVVNVTTDKVYENFEDGRAYTEKDRLGGYDMYSSSKACSEILSASFRRSFLNEQGAFHLATARAGNVIGGGDFSADRLVPDCMRSLAEGKPLVLRHPRANRPWQFVLEPLMAYLTLAMYMYQGKTEAEDCFNFGPELEQIKSVAEISALMIRIWGSGSIKCKSDARGHEASMLRLDNIKARNILGIAPVLTVEEAVSFTVKWYKCFFSESNNIRNFTLQQIDDFAAAALTKNLSWSK